MTWFGLLTGSWPKYVIINKVNKYCFVWQKSKYICLLLQYIYVQTEYIMECLKLATRLLIFKCRKKSMFQGHLVVPNSIIVSALVAADVRVANWPPSVQKPMGDDPVQSPLQSDQFSHTPIPLASFHFLPYKPKFSWRVFSVKF